MSNTLMDKALAVERLPVGHVPRDYSEDEEQVMVAYLNREITERQLMVALGKRSNAYQAVGTFLINAYRKGRVTLHERKEQS